MIFEFNHQPGANGILNTNAATRLKMNVLLRSYLSSEDHERTVVYNCGITR